MASVSPAEYAPVYNVVMFARIAGLFTCASAAAAWLPQLVHLVQLIFCSSHVAVWKQAARAVVTVRCS